MPRSGEKTLHFLKVLMLKFTLESIGGGLFPSKVPSLTAVALLGAYMHQVVSSLSIFMDYLI